MDEHDVEDVLGLPVNKRKYYTEHKGVDELYDDGDTKAGEQIGEMKQRKEKCREEDRFFG